MTNKDTQYAEADEGKLNLPPEPAPAPVTVVVEGAEDERATQQAKPDDDPLAALKAQVAVGQQQVTEERVRRQAAEAAASESQKKLRASVQTQMAAQFSAVDNGIHAWETAIDADKQALAKAHEAANFTDVAEIQFRLAQAAVKLEVLKEQKQSLERRREQVVKAAERRPVQQNNQGQAQDGSTGEMTKATQAWIDAHPQVLAPNEWQKAIALHDYGTRVKGLAADTPEYFSFIEEGMGYSNNNKQSDPVPPPRREANRTTQAAAPNRAGGGQRPGTPERVVLTTQEIELADGMASLGKTVQERRENYGRNKLALMKEGRVQGNA